MTPHNTQINDQAADIVHTLFQLWCMPEIGPKTIERLMPCVFEGWRLGERLSITLPKRQLHSLGKKEFQTKARQMVVQMNEWAEHPEHHLVFHIPPQYFCSANYPTLLAEIHSPPSVLMVKGNVQCLSDFTIAMVGSRNPSLEGERNASAFSQYLVEQGAVIVSGGAAGIDRAAHEAALNAGGKTIAVLGHGLSFCYPARHKALFARIAKQGALVSEFPLSIGPKPALFPRRNRIITGLSRGVCIVEAGLPSGSLVSAKWAYEQNREVFAIPGSIHNPRAKGCHLLIQQGAKLVQSGEDIISELSWVKREHFDSPHQPPENVEPVLSLEGLPLDQQLSIVLQGEALSLDEISLKFSQVSVQQLATTLSELEIEGTIQRDLSTGVLSARATSQA